jgi:hypothetical protein
MSFLSTASSSLDDGASAASVAAVDDDAQLPDAYAGVIDTLNNKSAESRQFAQLKRNYSQRLIEKLVMEVAGRGPEATMQLQQAAMDDALRGGSGRRRRRGRTECGDSATSPLQVLPAYTTRDGRTFRLRYRNKLPSLSVRLKKPKKVAKKPRKKKDASSASASSSSSSSSEQQPPPAVNAEESFLQRCIRTFWQQRTPEMMLMTGPDFSLAMIEWIASCQKNESLLVPLIKEEVAASSLEDGGGDDGDGRSATSKSSASSSLLMTLLQ